MGGREGNIIMEYGIETFVYKEENKYQIEAMPNTFGSTRWGIDRGRGKSNDVVLKEINWDMNKQKYHIVEAASFFNHSGAFIRRFKSRTNKETKWWNEKVRMAGKKTKE